MTKNNAMICDAIFAKMTDDELWNLATMPESEKFNLQHVMVMRGYKKIIRFHQEGYSPEEIAFKTGEDKRQVSRVIVLLNDGTYTP